MTKVSLTLLASDRVKKIFKFNNIDVITSGK